MLVKLTQDLKNGFGPWKEMLLANGHKPVSYTHLTLPTIYSV